MVLSYKSSASERKPAFIENRCHVCSSSYASPSYLIEHLKKHDIYLNPRKQGYRRPNTSTKYYFVKDADQAHRTFSGCPSCWYYCPTKEKSMKTLADHIHECHVDNDAGEMVESPVESEEEDDDEDEVMSSASSASSCSGQGNKAKKPTADDMEHLSSLISLTEKFSNMLFGKK